VLNMIGAHAAALILGGRLSKQLHRAYSLFFVIGTAGALQFPVVGLMPFKSMEQLGPLFVFIGMQVLWAAESSVRRQQLRGRSAWMLRARYAGAAAAVGVAVIAALIPTGYFGPLSMRVRSLFIKHTRTGNPLVDSVAEHQPTSADAYWHHLHYACYGAPLGFVLTLATARGDAKWFLILYALIAYYFANKMNRLIILMGPIASALSGVAAGLTLDWIVSVMLGMLLGGEAPPPVAPATPVKDIAAPPTPTKQASPSPATAKAAAKGKGKAPASAKASRDPLQGVSDTLFAPVRSFMATKTAKSVQAVVAVAILAMTPKPALEFWNFSHMFAEQMSQPSVVFKARLHSGETVMVTDYLDSYDWLKKNTPEDARILAWWDYGYQITGIGNRTTLADGNTWNLEHIALIGKCLTSTEKKAHDMIKHLADYVLVWAGGGGDDLAKSPHMARIGTSVFTDICGKQDPMCNQFGFYNDQRRPTPMMENSLLYKMTTNGMTEGVRVNEELFREVFTSRYHKVRIDEVQRVSQRSKRWGADPANRICDPPGSWQCPGQYPPPIQRMLDSAGPAPNGKLKARQMLKAPYNATRLQELSEATEERFASGKLAFGKLPTYVGAPAF